MKGWIMNFKELTGDFKEKVIPSDPKNFKVYTVVRSVSRSGMSRRINAYVISNNTLICIARDYKIDGCGMDMCWHFAYLLFHELYNNGMYNETFEYQNYDFHEHM